ncbi:PREDICTED: uncharacterized protein LOC109129144 [Camelina sativa]|uniref:Uncharacterized protein LOC109129144 n=1 Tax=Camelina sativa TaxID=90675 RepID=A0ABM1QZZ5_CAMSA|nr:PREDICTED: uncharacterized protein LOC109129144 [Camelina sativa]
MVKESIGKAWFASSSSYGQRATESLRRCRKALSTCKRENVTNSQVKINSIQRDIEKEHALQHPSFSRMATLKRDMVLAHREEESHWSQKSRDKWLLSGDKNTKYFHSSVKADRNKNALLKLIDGEGVTHRSEASKGDVAASYFQSMFSSSYPSEEDHQFFQDLTPRENDEMNASLIAELSKEEVRLAVFAINPSKAPRADGMTGLFFQKYWDIVGDQITKEVLSFFKDGSFDKEWNYTQLCLIPKKVNASFMSEMRPISLCSVMYKIISKIMVARLKPLLSDIVSPNQSAFVPERLIYDNIIIAHEIVHSLRTHGSTSKDFMAVKTDMSKAFDRVEWSYLQALLVALGFHPRWISWGPTIHHLLFADDSLFVCKAEERQCEALQNILDAYGRATGRTINLDKSSITFGEKVDERVKEHMKTKMKITNEGGAGSYLGLPECFSGSKSDMLEYINERMKSRFSGWFARTLSQGGKEVLIKTVAMAMPIFAMSCFKLPKSTCSTLSSAMSEFWWSNMENHKKIHWVSWNKLCLTKDQGGLGFKDIEVFNQALLAKQAWRLLHYPNSFFSLYLKSRYFPNDQFLDATLGARPSYAWRSILFGRELLVKGLRLCIGDGVSTSVWTGQWLQDGRMRAPLMKNPLINLELKVQDLIDPVTKGWDSNSLQEHFFPRDIVLIRKIKPVVSSSDYMCWQHNKSGEYSVSSGYWLEAQAHNAETIQEATWQPSLNAIKDLIWDSHAPTKVKIFMWKAMSGALL